MPAVRREQAQGLRTYISSKSQAPMLQVTSITSIILKIYQNLELTVVPIYTIYDEMFGVENFSGVHGLSLTANVLTLNVFCFIIRALK